MVEQSDEWQSDVRQSDVRQSGDKSDDQQSGSMTGGAEERNFLFLKVQTILGESGLFHPCFPVE